ncbi:redoxin domain-containing protein [Planomonospora sp. ID91781]|uniref:TlpA family protein disulfide reductase n=1 Tax=Planomonospora sp. ID91781 TaxID=2738135 RepID=UPI0018C4446D|nr:redoxin domain-containing protein [Planomonospora sp. ID91781]MBG0821548.1 redoxin domain-containing protein [Planomonospora sp. ID91781]
MPYLTAAVVLVGLLCSANTVLLLGVVRRLREHENRLPPPAEPSLGLPALGSALPSFASVTTAGEPVTSANLPLPAVVAFFDVACEPCRDKAPRFARELSDHPGLNALAVVIGEAGAMSATLEAACRVVVEPSDGTLVRAFGVRGFPAMCLLDERGVVVQAGQDLGLAPAAGARG